MTTYYNLQSTLYQYNPTENLDYETRLRLFGYTIEDLKTIITPWS
jgi:glutamate synthase (ferredoxin)